MSTRRGLRGGCGPASVGARAIFLALSLFLGLGAEAQDARPLGREERVIALLQRVARPDGWATGHWYPRSTFERLADGPAHAIVPRIPITCGNSRRGLFHASRARQLARDTFEIYGLAPRVDEGLASAHGRAVLDGYDVERRVGFELRGSGARARATGASAESEAAERELDYGLDDGLDDELDDAELRALEAQGVRIHVADVEDYPLMDGDQFTPTLAYLAGIVEVLNEVTEGEDVDLSAILLRHAQHFPLPVVAMAELAQGVIATRKETHAELVVRARATLHFELGGEHGVQPMDGRELRSRQAPPVLLEHPLPTLGAPGVLLLDGCHPIGPHALAAGESHVTMRLLQAAAGLDVRAPGVMLFTSSHFDATSPFVVELELAPGTYSLRNPRVIVGSR